nr:ribonuclease H-like domain-containing protein [Tanacetum cinerariifolium]
MSTQQDIYAAASESRPPMLNKENYMPWSSRLLRYAKSRPNGKLIHNSIINGPYVRRMIPKPGDTNREVPVNETFHVQTDDELTEKELKQIKADDQAIQTILLGLPEDIYAVVDSCETAQEIWLRVQQMMKGSNIGIQEKKAKVQQMMKGSNIGIQEKKAKLFNEWERLTSNKGESIESYMQQPMPNPEDITDPTTAMNMALTLMAKAFKLNYSTLTNNNQRISSNPRNRQIAQPGMNMVQDRQMQMVGDITDPTTAMNMALTLMDKAFKLNYSTPTNNNKRISSNPRNRQIAQPDVGNLNGYNAVQNVGNQVAQNSSVQNFGNQNGLIGVLGNGNQNGNADLDEIKEVNTNCILMANLQQASTSGTQTDKAPVYDSDGSAEVHDYENCNDNEIFNMFTQEEQYTELLESILDQHQVPQNDNNVISEVTSVEQSGETIEQ